MAARLGIAALVLLLSPQQPQDVDVLTLKDGTTRTGRILSETGSQIEIQTLIKGSKGQVVGTAKNTIDKANVARIERASDEARKKAADRSQVFGERGLRRAEALAKVRPVPIQLEGAKALQVAGTNFTLESTCEVGFVKDVAVCLEDAFTAYRKHFEIRRNADRKLKVYLFADKDEYVRFQKGRHGDAIMNAAYYHSEQNYIAAYNMIQRDEEKRVRSEIGRLENAIESFKGDVATVERRVNSLAKDLRKQIQDAAAEERKSIRADAQGGKDARLQQVDRQEKEVLEDLKRKETEAQKELQEARRKANEAIADNRKVIERNEKILSAQNRVMFEMLFHEGFHAFAANHLWEGSAQKEFPRWLNEGTACYFEMSVVEGGELIHGAPHAALLKLLKEKAVLNTLAPLEMVLRGGPEQFLVTHRSQQERSTTYYAQSWVLAHYLAGKVTRAGIAAYVGDVLSGQDSAKAFEKMMGKSCREVEADLLRHIESLKVP